MEATLPAARPISGGALGPLFRVKLTYWWRHRRLLDLESPRLFTELVQWRKLHDHDLRLPQLADKVRVKGVVADRLGPDWVIPTLWHGGALPAAPRWPAPFVVKSRHGCNQNVFVRDAAFDWPAIRRRANAWLGQVYGGWLDEWVYAHVPRGILVEPFVGTGPELPIDYKFYVFGGRVEFVQVHLGRGSNHRWIVFDRHWRRISTRAEHAEPQRPHSLGAMIEGAEILAQGIDFVRVDLYEIAGRPMFGEMTFYPGSGLDPFDPVGLDAVMGAMWLRARANAFATELPEQFGAAEEAACDADALAEIAEPWLRALTS